MLTDASRVPNGTLIKGDLCIIGAGAAGITLARELRRLPVKVILLESGGMQLDKATQNLYEGESNGLKYFLGESRFRYFGGTTNQWWGNCRPLDEIDFEKRDWVPHSGWPFAKKDLEPYYKRAGEVLRLGAYDDYEWESVKDDVQEPALAFKSGIWEAKLLQQSGALRFKDAYGPEIQAAPNIDAYTHANALEIVSTENGSAIGEVKAGTLSGNRFTIKAGKFVLAASGIENARILLHSNSVHKNGLGNTHDLVGRYFMEHPVLEAYFIPAKKDLNLRLYRYFTRHQVKGTAVWGMLGPSARYLRETRGLSAGFSFTEGVSEAVLSLDEIKRHMRGKGTQPLGPHIANILKDLDGMVFYGYQKKFKKLERHHMEQEIYILSALVEQLPDASNRVMLAEEKDALGMRRVRLHFEVSEEEKKEYWRLMNLFASEAGAEGYGRVKLLFGEEQEEWPIRFWDHQMGTTRMHDDPKQGVVDRNAKVHGLHNLYVAGSSVFPTGGFAPPTHTIVALALKLSDHLKDELE